MRLYLLLILVLAAGCSSVYHVEEKYAPLEMILPRGDLSIIGISDTAITTVGKASYVSNVDDWLETHPQGSLMYDAVLLHEQVHSKRQFDAGVISWLYRYLRDRDFMWEEEQRGWFVEIQRVKSGGEQVDADAVARILSGYRMLDGTRMVSYEDAREWVFSVLNGQWTPE